MKQALSISIIILITNTFALCQDSIIFRFDFSAFNIGSGFQKTAISGNVSSDEKFILNNNDNDIFGFGFLETDVYLYKFIGFRLGLGFNQTGYNEAKIRSDFRYQFDDYDVEIPVTNYDGGDVPFIGGFGMAYWQTGIIGEIRATKWLSFCPNICYFNSPGTNASFLDADFTHLTNGEQFRRKYTFKEGQFVGPKLGLDIRFVLDDALYLGVRLEYYKLTGTGKASYTDVYEDGTEVIAPVSDYTRNTNYYLISANFGVRIRSRKGWFWQH